MHIESDAQGKAKFIGGDAKVATTPDGHFASSHSAINLIERERTDPANAGAGGGGGGQCAPVINGSG